MWDMSLWKSGYIGEYTYQAKVYGCGSEYGIENGCISKMSIRKGSIREGYKELYHYDRGLDFDRLDAEGREVYEQILKKYN